VAREWGISRQDPSFVACRLKAARAAGLFAESRLASVDGKRGRGNRAVGVTREVAAQERRRRTQDQGRPPKCPDVSAELFNWWVDMAQSLACRVSSAMLIAQVQLILDDARNYAKLCIENGKPLPQFEEPEIDKVWLCRFRKYWGITKQSVNCQYVVSHAKVERRMGVIWRNAARLIVFHELLYGPDRLTFVSVDEKPFRFNATAEDKIWALRGQLKKYKKERRNQLLERWTGMSACFSRSGYPGGGSYLPDGRWVPKWAALFKAETGSRLALQPPSEQVLVQYAPKGSYRTEQFFDYIDWLLPDIADASSAVIPIADWHSAHLDESVHELVKAKTHGPMLLLGGGTTTKGAVPDQEPHHQLNQKYKGAQEKAMSRMLLERPHAVPKYTKQHVMTMGWESWCEVRHECSVKLHKQLGYSLAIEGEDHLISNDLRPYWFSPRLDMPNTRRRIKAEVQEMFAGGLGTCWEDVYGLMEKHEDHRAAGEGEESMEIVIEEGEEAEDEEDDGDDDFEGDDGYSDEGDDDENGGSDGEGERDDVVEDTSGEDTEEREPQEDGDGDGDGGGDGVGSQVSERVRPAAAGNLGSTEQASHAAAVSPGSQYGAN
jgi:hypothetical protein